jgi:hypothetical protein
LVYGLKKNIFKEGTFCEKYSSKKSTLLKRMGAKPVHQLAPYIITDYTRESISPKRKKSDRTKAAVWVYIHSNLKRWWKLSTRLELLIISDRPCRGHMFNNLKVERQYYYAVVTEVDELDHNQFLLHIKVKRRLTKKKLDYHYGGAINYLDSYGNF